jgi:hypothetical protein
MDQLLDPMYAPQLTPIRYPNIKPSVHTTD